MKCCACGKLKDCKLGVLYTEVLWYAGIVVMGVCGCVCVCVCVCDCVCFNVRLGDLVVMNEMVHHVTVLSVCDVVCVRTHTCVCVYARVCGCA